jgi:hypothetical protein
MKSNHLLYVARIPMGIEREYTTTFDTLFLDDPAKNSG